MALTDDLTRIMGYDQGPDNNSEVNIKIKPLGSVSGGAATAAPAGTQALGGAPSAPGLSPASGVGAAPGGLSMAGAGAAQDQAALPSFFGQGASVVPQDQWRSYTNPQLVTHPLGKQTDSMYEAAVAQLQNQTNQQYLDTLKEIGWMGDQGQFMPGTLETEAVRQRADINRQRELALQDVINKAVGRNAVFSGRRATLQSQAQAPYDAALANLEGSLGRELGNRYELLGRITGNFETSRNMLLAEAADRIAREQQRVSAGAGYGSPGYEPGPSEPSGPGYAPGPQSLGEALMAGIPSGPQPGFGDFGGVTNDDWLRAIQQQGGWTGASPY